MTHEQPPGARDLLMRALDAHQNPMATAETFIARRSSLAELRGCLTKHDGAKDA